MLTSCSGSMLGAEQKGEVEGEACGQKWIPEQGPRLQGVGLSSTAGSAPCCTTTGEMPSPPTTPSALPPGIAPILPGTLNSRDWLDVLLRLGTGNVTAAATGECRVGNDDPPLLGVLAVAVAVTWGDCGGEAGDAGRVAFVSGCHCGLLLLWPWISV